jgi:fatty-acyl-CoA synthase
MYELHFVVPMAGAIICALKSRLDAAMASNLLRHSEAKIVFIDAALLGVAQEALRLMSVAGARALVSSSSEASSQRRRQLSMTTRT